MQLAVSKGSEHILTDVTPSGAESDLNPSVIFSSCEINISHTKTPYWSSISPTQSNPKLIVQNKSLIP